MLIRLRDENNKLLIKDVFDIDFDMSVEEKNHKYYVVVNSQYHFDGEFSSQLDAEKKMIEIADDRNNLEEELKNY